MPLGFLSPQSELLALETSQNLGVVDDIIGQKLQGHKSVEGWVLALWTRPFQIDQNLHTCRL